MFRKCGRREDLSIDADDKTTTRHHKAWRRRGSPCTEASPLPTHSVPTMKNLTLIASLIAASALPFAASAQTANTINLKGEIIASACSASSATVAGGTSAAASNASGIEVNLGKVSVNEIGTSGAAFSASSSLTDGAGANVAIEFNCPSAPAGGSSPTKFTVSFNPRPGDIANASVGTLAVTGGATGVAIALVQDNKVINIQNSSPAVAGTINGTKGVLNLRAMYVRNGAAAPTPGMANASLPFTLRYE